MNVEISEALGDVLREKDIEKEFLIDAISAGINAGLKRKYGEQPDTKVSINLKTGDIDIYIKKKVVKRCRTPYKQISYPEAKKIDPECELGNELMTPFPVEKFGRNAIIVIKQTVIQKIREFQQEKIFEIYEGKVGSIVTGTIQKVDKKGLIVILGQAEAFLPAKEQLKIEKYRQGNPIRVLILDAKRSSKGHQIVLSRTHPDFLLKLFRFEVPEVYEGIVEIKSLAREPGERSKIAVYSKDNKIDPVGACVGVRGSRIRSIVKELSGEKIDVVQWSSDRIVYITRSLSPAKPSNIIIEDEEEKTLTAVIPDDQFSLAIGKGGQNARLASRLTGWNIDIIKESEYIERIDRERKSKVLVKDIARLSETVKKILIDANFITAYDIDQAEIEALTALPKIGDKTVQKIKKIVAESVK